MDQEAAIQAYLAKYKNPRILEIVGTYVRTPKGRNKLASSMIQPVRLALDYLSSTSKNWEDLDYSMGGRVAEYNLFLATVPEEEQQADPFPELKSLVERLQLRINEVKARSYPPA